ncbi:hypothetical protein FQN53_001787 [Emmonsiellopsis sp. PD_33]|nr:hypothetical protein FQN53_001787 [Emmonsiellopsis sp. PD_33]
MSDFSFVDLTSSSPSSSADQNLVTMYSHHPRSQLSFDVPEGARSPKRRRLDHSSIAGPSSHPSSHHRQFSIPNNEPNIESIDLTEVNDGRALSKALAKQRADAIKAQNSRADEARSTLTAYKCPIPYVLAKSDGHMMDTERHRGAIVQSADKYSPV